MFFHDFKKDNVSLEKLVKIQIPSTLRKQLVDDWEFVTQQDKVSLKCYWTQLKKGTYKVLEHFSPIITARMLEK